MLFEYSFLLKSLIVSLFLGVVFSLLGIFVFLKRMTFFSDGIAHASILPLSIAFLLNLNKIFLAIFGGIIFSLSVYYLERKTKIHTDTLIGLIFITAFSLGIILMAFKSGYQPELLSFLIGNILSISDTDFIIISFLSVILISFLILNFKKILLVLLDPVEAKLQNINVTLYEIIFYFILGISIILGIKIVGIILITAFLILPTLISNLISLSFKEFIFFNILFSFIIVLSGFIVSILYNLPLGASIVLSGFLIFITLFFLKKFVKI
jgi:zinc transport system permease protein